MPHWSEKILEGVLQPGIVLVRDLDAPERLGAVVDGEALSHAEAAFTIRQASGAAFGTLKRVPAGGWSVQVATSRFDPLPAWQRLSTLVIAHAYEHLAQIRQGLG